MRSRNYTKEIDLTTEERPVPMTVTAAILLTVVVLALLFARQVNALNHPPADPAKARAEVKVSSG
jgi:hypothetical protein